MNSFAETQVTGRAQAVVSLFLLAWLGLMTLGIDWLARNRVVAAVIHAEERRFTRKVGIIDFVSGYFQDAEDRMLLDELPNADYSRGSVVFLGSSNAKWAIKLWDLPAREQDLIHNYCLGAANHTDTFNLLKFLVEHEGLLRAGPEKTLVVFAVSYHTVAHDVLRDAFVPNLWRRHGFYDYSPETGVTVLDVAAMTREWVTERERVAGFCGHLANAARLRLSRFLGRDTKIVRVVHDSQPYNAMWNDWMGPNWKEKMERQLRDLNAASEYLHRLGVPVEVVLLPEGTWDENQPYREPYRSEVRRLCAAGGIPLHDWAHALTDGEFGDSVHPNLDGQDKLEPRWLGIAEPFLKRTGALGMP